VERLAKQDDRQSAGKLDSDEKGPRGPTQDLHLDSQNRGRINVTAEDFQKAALLTGKTKPAEIFRELIRQVESKDPYRESGQASSKFPLEYNANPAQYRFNSDNRSERGYWQMRSERAKALTAELHFSREVAKMDKSELELVMEAPKRLPETAYVENVKCYNCHERGHWPSQCPKAAY